MSKADTFIFRANSNGTLNMTSYNKARLKEYMKQNHGKLMVIRPKQIESSKQRGWFEGALIPLIAYYQEFMDHRNGEDLDQVRQWLKLEFNADLVAIGGKTHKIAKSTKGVLNEGLIENILAWANEQGMKTELLDPQIYKHWHDTLYPYGGPDNFIDYLCETKKLP